MVNIAFRTHRNVDITSFDRQSGRQRGLRSSVCIYFGAVVAVNCTRGPGMVYSSGERLGRVRHRLLDHEKLQFMYSP